MSRIESNDVVLTKNSDNIYDINFDSQGDIETDDFLDTSLLRSILGERRASPDEVPTPQLRRGWIGSVTRTYEDGSKIWLYEQSPLNRTTLNGIKDEANLGLQWLLDGNVAVSYKVSTSIDSDNSIVLNIEIQKSTSKVENRYYKLFENSGVR
ncbi:MAG: phage GP46 family protein [Actinomycetia bacterium]|nr:phage GP46 family protein [Actinomycetes bacterium]